MIRFIAGAVVGVVAGSVTTFFITKHKFDKKFAEVEDTYKAISERKKIKMNEKSISDEVVDNKTALDTKSFEEMNDVGSDDDDNDEDEDEDEDNAYTNAMRQYRGTEYPYIITAEEWEDTSNHFDKREAVYYPNEDRADDVTNVVAIEDIDEMLGADMGNLEDQIFDDSDNGYVYIRNPRHGIDWCVERSLEAFIE